MIIRLWSKEPHASTGIRPKDAVLELWYLCSTCGGMDGPLDSDQIETHQHYCQVDSQDQNALRVRLGAWTEEEDAILVKYLPRSALALLPKRTLGAARVRRSFLRSQGVSLSSESYGSPRANSWTTEEDRIVTLYQPAVAHLKLPGRTLSAIHGRRAVLKKRGVLLSHDKGEQDTEVRAYRRAGYVADKLAGRAGRCVDCGTRFPPTGRVAVTRAVLQHWKESCTERRGLIVPDF